MKPVLFAFPVLTLVGCVILLAATNLSRGDTSTALMKSSREALAAASELAVACYNEGFQQGRVTGIDEYAAARGDTVTVSDRQMKPTKGCAPETSK